MFWTTGLIVAVYVPAAWYMLMYTRFSGDVSEGIIPTLLGTVIAVVNGVLSFLIWQQAQRMGFVRKAARDVFILIASTVLLVFATCFEIYMTLDTITSLNADIPLSMQAGFGEPGAAGRGVVAVRAVQIRLVMAEALWKLLMPGTILLPWIVYFFKAYVMNLTTYIFYFISIPLHPIYSWRDLRTDPQLKPFDAEKALEPYPIQLQYDYSTNIFVSTAGFSLLFFETRYAHWVCFGLLAWVIFTYDSQKYAHLKLTKVQLYATPWLDKCANHLWGVPLSMIAASAAHFASLSEWLPPASAVPVFCISLALYWVPLTALTGFWLFDKSVEEHTDIYAEVDCLYNWFNTNPIHVLKTIACKGEDRDDSIAQRLVLFRRGKEYMQGEAITPGAILKSGISKLFENSSSTAWSSWSGLQ